MGDSRRLSCCSLFSYQIYYYFILFNSLKARAPCVMWSASENANATILQIQIHTHKQRYIYLSLAHFAYDIEMYFPRILSVLFMFQWNLFIGYFRYSLYLQCLSVALCRALSLSLCVSPSLFVYFCDVFRCDLISLLLLNIFCSFSVCGNRFNQFWA